MRTLKESILDKDFDVDYESLFIKVLKDVILGDCKNKFTYELKHNYEGLRNCICIKGKPTVLNVNLGGLYKELHEFGIDGVMFEDCPRLWFFLMEKKTVIKNFTIYSDAQSIYFCDESGYNGTFEFENSSIRTSAEVIAQESAVSLKKKSTLQCSDTHTLYGSIMKDGSSKIIVSKIIAL